MGPMTRLPQHRLAVDLPFDKTLEEVILARKLTSQKNCVMSDQGLPDPQRGGMLVSSPMSVASCLSKLPPEAYTREVSSRLGKRPRSRVLRRSTPNRIADGDHRRGGCYTPQQLRPLTGVSPPSTAQSSFRPVAYFSGEDNMRPVTSSSQSPPPRGGAARTSTPGYNDTGDDPNDHVAFLTDKCNALSIRLQQVEAQLFSERAEGNQRRLLCASPSHSTASTTHNFDPEWQHSHSRTSTADPRSSPRNRLAARLSSHAPLPRAPRSPSAGFNGDSNRGEGPSRAVETDYDGSRRSGFLEDDDDGGGYICATQGYYEAGEDLATSTNFIGARAGSASPSPLRGKAQSASSLRAGLASPEGYRENSSWLAEPAAGGDARSMERARRPAKKGAKMDEDALHCERVEKEIAHRFDIVTDGMEKLDNIFSNAAQILEHRVHAITTISSIIRMFLQRCRYLRAKVALKAWRTEHSVPVLQCLRGEVLRQKTIEIGLQSLQRRYYLSMVSRTFRSWSTVVGADEQRKLQLKLLGERVKRRELLDLVRKVFRELREHTVGPSSSRELARRGRVRLEEARERIVARAAASGEAWLVTTNAMVRKEMSRKAVEVMQAKMNVNLFCSALEHLKEAVVLRKGKEVTANAHFERWATRRVVEGWRKWAVLKSNGLDRTLMKGYPAGKKRVGCLYNPKKVAAFARRRAMSSVFLAWARRSKLLAIVTRKQRKVLTALAVHTFDTWREEARRSKQVKKIAIGMWTDFALKDLAEPFRLWYIYADTSKRRTADHERLLRLYRRSKNRKKCHRILKAWKHLAMYGRIEGMYTRVQLMSSLAEQKDHTLRLVGKVDELAGGLGDMEELAMDYRSQMIARQREILERDDGMDRQTMALHHAEQEVVRLQCLLASAAEAAPHICKAIHQMAPGFDFKERGLEPFSKARAETLELEVQERVAKLAAELVAEQNAKDKKLASTHPEHQDGQSGDKTKESTSPRRQPTALSPQQQLLTSTNEINSVVEEADDSTVAKTTIIATTADAQTQVRLPADPEAAARAALAVSALAQGVQPPILPRELSRLDRVEWVLRRTSLAEVSARLKKQEKEDQERLKEGTRRGRESDDSSDGYDDSDDDGRRNGGGGDIRGAKWASRGGGGEEGGREKDGAIEKNVGPGERHIRHQDESAGRQQHGNDEKNIGGLFTTTDAVLATPSQTADSAVVTAAATVTTVVTATAPTRKSSTDAGRQEEASSSGSGGRGRDERENDEDDEDEGYGVVDRLAALFEFLRTGNSFILPPDLQDEWEARPDLGLGLLSADDHAYDPHPGRGRPPPPASTAPAAAPAGGVGEARTGPGADSHADGEGYVKSATTDYSDRASRGGGRGGVSSWRRLCRDSNTGGGEPMTFHDLQMALTATTQRWRTTETTDDKLERRLVERRKRADKMTAALWGNERGRVAENLYIRPPDL